MQADDVASRLRQSSSNLAAAKEQYQALLMGASGKKLLELCGNPSPPPHGSEVRVLSKEERNLSAWKAKADMQACSTPNHT